jgi:hypothetical protein
MIQSIMLCGIGVLAGCLAMLLFFPLIHARAVRITRRDFVDAVPLAINEIRADKDHLRAQFAMSVRRLEVSIEEMRAKAAGQNGEIGRQNAEINRLSVELDKKTALIYALRAREAVRKNILRRVLKTLLYMFVRSNRDKRPSVKPKMAAVDQAPSLAPNLATKFTAEFGKNLTPSLGSLAAAGPTLGAPLSPPLGSPLAPSLAASLAANLGAGEKPN